MKAIIAASFAVIALWAVWISQKFVFQWVGSPWDSELLAQLGDTFGALNALFSALAFIAVLFTLKQQRDDLNRQQKQIFRAERDQHVQRFEQTFYELLRLLREARSDVEFRYSREYQLDGSPSEQKPRVETH